MATFTTGTYDAQNPNRNNISRLLDKNIASGEVEFAVVQYALAGTEAANDVIDLCILPAGVTPVPQLSKITCGADPGTTLTMHVGTAAAASGWINGAVLSAGGEVSADTTNIATWVTPTPLAADAGSGNAVVFATVASANTLTASTVLTFLLAFKRGR